MAERTPPDGWITAKSTKRKLGNISDGKLRSLTGEGPGKIERMQPPDSTYGFYKASDVHRIQHEWNQKALEANEPTLPGAHFQVATKEDMPEIVDLLIKIFGGGDTSARRNSWLDRNPESCFVVRSHGKVRGCIFVLSFTEEKIHQLHGKDNYATHDIEANDILPFEAGKPANLFLLSMASDDIGVGKENRRKWGSFIIRGLYAHIQDLGRRGIPVNLVASRSSLPDGIRIMRKMGFFEIEPCGDRKNFIIDVKMSGLDFAMKHKA
ncbi:MAG TPA: hypothetical protein VHV10_15725, partial [Ktedonobacteraceae bacterium]|nr:hypothetical protein [Ktedonobacteraceae bacterium]